MTNSGWVTITALFLWQAVSLITVFHMTNSMWVNITALFLWLAVSHQSSLIPWPTGSEWHCLISLPVSLINNVSSHDKQRVSDTALFLCQAVSSIMFHLMTNRQWVTLLYFFTRQSHINHISSHDQQGVSDTALFLARQSHQSCLIPWPTDSE